MAFQRHQRVSSLIQEELNKIILRELEFGDALVTLTRIEVQKDLDYAAVNFSVIPVEKSKEVLRILNKNRRHLQYLLLRKINIKPMPEIRFQIDYGLEKAAKIEKVLLELTPLEVGRPLPAGRQAKVAVATRRRRGRPLTGLKKSKNNL